MSYSPYFTPDQVHDLIVESLINDEQMLGHVFLGGGPLMEAIQDDDVVSAVHLENLFDNVARTLSKKMLYYRGETVAILQDFYLEYCDALELVVERVRSNRVILVKRERDREEVSDLADLMGGISLTPSAILSIPPPAFVVEDGIEGIIAGMERL